MIAVAGSMVGTAIGVITLFAVLYTEVPTWGLAWSTACAALLVGSSLWAWQRPRQVASALRLGVAAAIAGVGWGVPALRAWIQVGPADLARVEIGAVGVTLGLACACYLAFAAAELVRTAELGRVRAATA